MTKRVACIGTREPATEMKQHLISIGGWLAWQGWTVASGNALGCDQLFAQGANKTNPSKVVLYLPWRTYETNAIHRLNELHLADEAGPELIQLAEQAHPAWKQLSQGVRKLMIRNVQIVHGSKFVVALPSKKLGGGGTGHGIRVAGILGIPVYDLNDPAVLKKILDKIASTKS